MYQAIYVQGRGALRRELAACLRTGQAPIEISERPAEPADQAVPGHWEGDLVFGKTTRSVIGTLVERSTRFVMLLHLPNGHSVVQVQDRMTNTMRTLPTQLRSGLARNPDKDPHAEFSMATDLRICFCNPKSPWRPGTNESTNGLLRQYFPKDTNLSIHSADHLASVAASLNGRPRETLGWLSPAQSLNRLLSGQSHIATTP